MMDEKDALIIEMLSKNARMPYLKIAKILNISETAVRKRIKKLEEKGVIEGYTIKVNPEKLGYKSVAHVGINTNPNYFLKVACRLTEMHAVKCVAIVAGGHSIMVDIWAKDSKHLEKILNDIKNMEGVISVNPSVILERLKSW
ncbi:MAG: Lrp/AsnC family transcriptional regulator [Thermoplasmata archaeon]|nr:Lrp/AsnC family transcriptional regulator [Thermoplasmata archaeon]